MPSDPRIHTTATRVTGRGKKWIDVRCEAHGVTSADVLRAALQVAANHPGEVDRLLSAKEAF